MAAGIDRRVSVSQAHEVATLEMTRPDAKNAMDTRMLEELIEALASLAADEHVRAVVITGGTSTFSAGADIVEEVTGQQAHRRMRLFGELYERVLVFPKPTVAAIAGPCIGGGAEVASACDLRVGTPKANIRFPGGLFGIPVGAARLPMLVGMSHAKDLLMTARPVTGEEAYRMGFLNRLADPSQLLATASALAQNMASVPGSVTQKWALASFAGLRARTWEENRALNRWQAESGKIGT